MAMTETTDYPRGLTFERVWAALMENKEQMKETSREMEKLSRETDRKISKLGSRFGELVEHLVAPNIKEKFKALELNFEQISHNIEISDSKGRFLAEIDLLMENGDIVIAIEIKSKPNQKDIKDHINRLEILRRRADARNDIRKFQGAIAGAVVTKPVRDFAHKTGFYVVEQTGDTVQIVIPENFKPREW